MAVQSIQVNLPNHRDAGYPDDKLAGYSVNGGTITLGKLDNASPTEILSRNVVVNGKVSADELNVVAGNNYVNAAGRDR